MSHQAVTWAMDNAPMLRMPKTGLPDTTARAVLVARAERADEDGLDTHAGIEDVIWRTGFDGRTIQRAQERLERAGLLVQRGETHWGTTRWDLDMTLLRDPADLGEIQTTAAKKKAKHADRERARRADKAAAAKQRADAESARADAESARADLNDARADAVPPEPPKNHPVTVLGTTHGGTLPPDPLRTAPPTGSRTDEELTSADQDQPLEPDTQPQTAHAENETAPLPTTTVASPASHLCAHGQDTRRTTNTGQPRCKPCRTTPAAATDTTSTPAPGPCGTPGCVHGTVLVGDALQHCPGDHPDPAPAAPRPHRGPAPAAQVWIAIARKGVEAHRPLPDEPYTGCNPRRSTRTGLTLTADQATTRHRAHWCLQCWPATESETP